MRPKVRRNNSEKVDIMQYRLLKTMSKLVCCLPYGALAPIGKGLGTLYYHIVKKQRNLSIAHMRRGMGYSEDEAKKMTMKLCHHMGQSFLEMMWMPRLNKDNISKYVEMDHPEYVADALKEGHGIVVLTAHIGNWEWMAARLAMEGFPVTTVVKRQPNDQHTKILNEYREMVGVEVFSRGTTELVAAAKALKKGKILGFLADQDAGRSGAFIEFLGEMASTPLGPAVFAKRFRSPVIPIFIVRKPEGGHRMLIQPPVQLQATGDEERDLYENTKRMTKIIEDVIRAYPQNWLWFQRRWNTPIEKADEKALKAQ
jgi:KDO2-lipid IV(A) lauroyltransferase